MSAENMEDKEVREYDGYNYKFISSEECNVCDLCSFEKICEERENKALEVLGDCSEEGREDRRNGYFILTSEKVTKEIKKIKKEPEKTIISHREEFVVKTKRTTATGKDLTTSQFTGSGTLEDAKILLADLQKRQGNEKYCIKGIKCDPPKIIKLTTIVTEEDVFDAEEGTAPSEKIVIDKQIYYFLQAMGAKDLETWDSSTHPKIFTKDYAAIVYNNLDKQKITKELIELLKPYYLTETSEYISRFKNDEFASMVIWTERNIISFNKEALIIKERTPEENNALSLLNLLAAVEVEKGTV